jgi:hypothetical protein
VGERVFSLDRWGGYDRAVLVERRSLRATIAHAELVRQLRTVRLDPDSNALAAMLGEISTRGRSRRGMSSVLVVHTDGDKMPGEEHRE